MIQIYIMIMVTIAYAPTMNAKSSTLRGLFGGACAGTLIGGVAGGKQGAALGALAGGIFGTAVGASKDVGRSRKKEYYKRQKCSHEHNCQEIYQEEDDNIEEHKEDKK